MAYDPLSPMIQAKIKEGLDAARRGELIDGEAFFKDWKERLDAALRADPKPRAKSNRRANGKQGSQ